MPKIVNNPAVVFAIVALSIYWLAELLLPTDLLIQIIRSLAIGVTVAVVVRHTPNALNAFRHGARLPYQQHQIAIVLTFSGILLTTIGSLIWRGLGHPDWWPNHPLNGFVIYLAAIGCLLYLFATRRPKEPPLHIWLTISAIVMAGSLMAGVVLSML